MKLASKIMLLFLVAVIAITGLFSYLTIRQDAIQFNQEHERHASELVESMKPHLLDAWNEGGHDKVAQAISVSAKRIRSTSVSYVQLDDNSDEKSPTTTTPEVLASVRQKETVTMTVTDSNGKNRVHTIFPLDIDGEARGGIDVSESTDSVDEEARETITNSVLSVAGVALISAVMLIFGGVRMVGRPLNLLVEKTKRVGRGDFSGPLELNRKDELGQLATALNEMCNQLSQQRETIQAETASRRDTELQLRHADRLKTIGRLATGIAHEMGTPLNVVSGRAGLISSGKLTDEEIRQSAVVIKTEADRIAKIIRELLDFARRSTPQRSVTDLREVIDQAVDLLQTFAKKRNISLTVDSEGDCFQTNVDAGQIQQVLTNLLMNAMQSIDEEGKVDVRLASTKIVPPQDVELKEGEYFRIDVQDTGSGIAEEHLHEIFEPFFTTKDVGEGTGLGLSISYGIIREHGGWIDVTSEEGRGSCFSIFLPQNTQIES